MSNNHDENVRIKVSSEGTDKAANGLNNVAKALGKTDQAAQRSRSGLKQIGPSLTSIASAVAPFAISGVVAMGAAIGGVAAAGLQMNNSIEQATGRINAFTKDAGKTAEVIDTIRDRAAKTPFSFQEMTNAAASLLPVTRVANTNLESLMETAEALAASNPAQGLEGAVFSLREALGGDFVSIVDRFDLPRQRIKELKEQGLPNIEIIRTAMSELGIDASLVGNLAETMSGRWSTLGDTFTNVASKITQPIFDTASQGLGTLNKLLADSEPQLNAFAEGIANKVQFAVDQLPAVVDAARDSVLTFVQALQGDWQDNADKIEPIHRVFGNIGLIVGDLGGMIREIWTALQDGDEPVATADEQLTDLADVLAEIRDFTNEGAQAIRDFNTALQPVADGFNIMAEASENAGAAVRSFLKPIFESGGTLERWAYKLNDIVNAMRSFLGLTPLLPGSTTREQGGQGGPRPFNGVPAWTKSGTGGGLGSWQTTINVDARGSTDPRAVEAAGYRGAKKAMDEAGRKADLRKRAG